MSNKRPSNKDNDLKKEKILYGENQLVCFACGEKINIDTKVCPYCMTKQNRKEHVRK